MQFKKVANPLFILFLLSITCPFVQAQNLVINPSFEDYDTCIQNQINYGYPIINDWITPTLANAGYYNFSSFNPNCRPIGNVFGSQIPKSGNGFTGLYIYTSNPNLGIIPCSEFTQGKLTSSLLSDSFYCVKFFVSCSENYKLAIDRLEAYLSNNQVISTTTCFQYFL